MHAKIKSFIDMALHGNEAMIRLFLDHMLPAKPTDEPIQIDMTDAFDFNNWTLDKTACKKTHAIPSK
ncbi:MAG: hypothetical protein Q8R24_08165 [Legionellaceae bacterium]|nr:hypothetical protein [Legionellaceae bacterium]